jgi:hypothetical protein
VQEARVQVENQENQTRREVKVQVHLRMERVKIHLPRAMMMITTVMDPLAI